MSAATEHGVNQAFEALHCSSSDNNKLLFLKPSVKFKID